MEEIHRWHPLVRDWRRTLRAENKAHRTIGNYLETIELFIDWLDDRPVPPGDWCDVDTGLVKDWIGELLERWKPSTVLTRYAHLRQWFKFLVDEEEIDAHPMEGMKPPQVPENPPPVVPLDVVRSVLAVCKGRSFAERRDTALIRLFFDTGCRLSEVALLKVDDVDLDVDLIHVVGKGSRPRSVPFSAKTGQALSRYLRARAKEKSAKSPYLWLGMYNRGPMTSNGIKIMIRRRGRQAGVNEKIGRNLHAHLGRHFQSSSFLEAGGSEGDLMRLNGWKSPAMAKHYGAAAAVGRAQQASRKFSLGDRL